MIIVVPSSWSNDPWWSLHPEYAITFVKVPTKATESTKLRLKWFDQWDQKVTTIFKFLEEQKAMGVKILYQVPKLSLQDKYRLRLEELEGIIGVGKDN